MSVNANGIEMEEKGDEETQSLGSQGVFPHCRCFIIEAEISQRQLVSTLNETGTTESTYEILSKVAMFVYFILFRTTQEAAIAAEKVGSIMNVSLRLPKYNELPQTHSGVVNWAPTEVYSEAYELVRNVKAYRCLYVVRQPKIKREMTFSNNYGPNK